MKHLINSVHITQLMRLAVVAVLVADEQKFVNTMIYENSTTEQNSPRITQSSTQHVLGPHSSKEQPPQ